MKKFLAILLSVVLCVSAFAVTVMADTDATESTNVALNKTYTTSTLFRQDSTYTWNPESDITYPDEDGITLTDGLYPEEGAAFTDAIWVGFNSNFPEYEGIGYHSITVDLGESTKLSKFVMAFGTVALGSGIKAPNGVEVYVSDDNATWGEAVGSATPVNSDASVNESLAIEATATGRYVQFRFTSSGWAFISEVEVYNAVATEGGEGEEGGNTEGGENEGGNTEGEGTEGEDEFNSDINGDGVVDWKDGHTTDDKGAYTFDNAYGFVFNVGSVNGTIKGEDITVITSADAYNAANPNWAISVLLAPTDEANVYSVVKVVATPQSAAGGIEAGINFDNGNIVLLVHSSGSLPEQTKEDGTVQTFANWEGKVAALALKEGDEITFAGVDLEAATATEATATVQDAPEGYVVTNGVGDDDEEGEEGDKDEVSLEDELKEALGEANENPAFELEINAPESYKAGDEITVTVTVKNITAENGIHVVEFVLLYDNDKLVVTNDLDEDAYNAFLCTTTMPSGWEELSKVANDWTEETEEGTTVNALNDGIIEASAGTDSTSATKAAKEDGSVVFTFTFTAKEDATGDLGFVIPNESVAGSINTKEGATAIVGNGDYAITADGDVEEQPESKPEEGDKEDDVKPGDASSMIVFAIIALVAIAGSAVVIKSRK